MYKRQVHDTLSQSVDETVALDAIIDLAVSAVLDVAAAGTPVQAQRTGSFGRVRAEDATALAMIVSELVQNAVEHGLGAGGGAVGIDARRGADDEGEFIVVTVDDDGYGLPDHPVGRSGLGMQLSLIHIWVCIRDRSSAGRSSTSLDMSRPSRHSTMS